MGAPQERSILGELQSFASDVARKAAAHLDDVEVWVTRLDQVAFAIENRTLAPELKLGRLQVGLRGLKGSKLAVAATTSFAVDENVSALKAAVPVARPTRLARFSPLRLDPTTRAFDEGVARLLREPRALQSLAVDVRDRALAEAEKRPEVDSLVGRVAAQTRWRVIATKEGGGAALESMTVVSAEANSARAEREVFRVWPADETSVRDVGARAVRALPPKAVAPVDWEIEAGTEVLALCDPEVVESFFRYPAHDHFLASSLEAGLASHEPGEALADPRLRLVDTGRPNELARDFDDELCARGETVLLDRGRFGAYVTSRQSAMETGLPETGNGVRRPILAEDDNEAPVRDTLLGLAMDPGERPTAELMRAADRVIVVRSLLGIHGADRARTAFSATVADGLAVVRGKVAGRLAPGRWNVSGRVLPGDGEPGLLQAAEPGRELTFTGSALLPHLLVRLTVS